MRSINQPTEKHEVFYDNYFRRNFHLTMKTLKYRFTGPLM